MTLYFGSIKTTAYGLSKKRFKLDLVGNDVCVPVVFVWEETGVPGGNTPV